MGPGACGVLGAEVVETDGQVGGGAIPLAELKSGAIALAPGGYSATQLEIRLRRSDPPVVSRIHEDRVLLDLRCVNEGDEEILTRILRQLADEIAAR